MALAPGAASLALAAPAKNDKPLVDSDTVSKSLVTKPGSLVDIDAVVGRVGSIAEKLGAKNDLASKTNALGVGGTR